MACCCNNEGPCTTENCNVCGFDPLLQLDLEITAPQNLLFLAGPLYGDCVCDEELTYSVSTVLSPAVIDADGIKWFYRSDAIDVDIIGWPCCGLGNAAQAWFPYVKILPHFKPADANFNPDGWPPCYSQQPCVKQRGDAAATTVIALLETEGVQWDSLLTTNGGNKCPTGSRTFEYTILTNGAYGGPYTLGSYTLTIL
jgi:hypothetical protein